jgi:hypothetical protein
VHTVIETEDFIADAKAAGMTDAERAEIVTYYGLNPKVGDEIKGTGGARKTRFRRPGTGKSGGYRVISFYSGLKLPVFLLNVFAKSDRVNLSQAECNELRKELKKMVAAYLEMVKANAKKRRQHV